MEPISLSTKGFCQGLRKAEFTFTPNNPFTDDVYTLPLQLEDVLGNRGDLAQYRFTVDTTAPPAPEITTLTTPTHLSTQVIGGSKKAYSKILLEGWQVVDHTPDTSWTHPVNLSPGANTFTFTFTAVDRAGIPSPETTVEIVYDDVPPPAVDVLTLDLQGNGVTVTLDWSTYDEAAHGDVAATGFTWTRPILRMFPASPRWAR